jgi:fluoride ion exporter CrcB/FEX
LGCEVRVVVAFGFCGGCGTVSAFTIPSYNKSDVNKIILIRRIFIINNSQ